MSNTINRKDAINAIEKLDIPEDMCVFEILSHIELAIGTLPSVEPEIIRCKDCKWWEREAEDSPMGYCHACKHGHYSRHWEIHIIRTYEEDFFCADAELKEEEEEE